MGDILLPNEFTLPPDLVNTGERCHDCQSRHIVYCITSVNPCFPLGYYCYQCLLKHVRATRRTRYNTIVPEYMIPMPMEWNLLGRIKVDLGLEKPAQIPSF
jgi:hypothetical protein